MKTLNTILLAAILIAVSFLVSKVPKRESPKPIEAYWVGLTHGWKVRDSGFNEADLEKMFFMVTSNDARAFSNYYAAKVTQRK